MGDGSRWRRLFRFLAGGTPLPARYAAFRRLLAYDRTAHDCLAELEEIGLGQRRVDWLLILARYDGLLAAVSGMAAELSAMAPWRYRRLPARIRACDRAVRRLLPVPARPATPPYVLELSHPAAVDPLLCGGKAARLALIHQTLRLPVPVGFVVTTRACHCCLTPQMRQAIDRRLATLDLDQGDEVAGVAAELTALLEKTALPDEVRAALAAAVERLGAAGVNHVAVRSSALAEDGELTFAGQYRTVLRVPAAEATIAYCQVLASRYGERALHYRIRHGLADAMTPMAVLVLAMVEAAVSGVMTVGDGDDPQAVVIHAVAGQGGPLVGGAATPEVIRAGDERAASSLLTAAEIERLAEWGRRIARHFGQPQDIEWCRDREGRLFLLQCRPLPPGAPTRRPEAARAAVALPVLLQGGERAVGGVGSGLVVRLRPGQPLPAAAAGSVLVAPTLPPEYAPVLPLLAAVVAEQGSSIGHAALVAREYGVPTLVNVPGAMAALAEGEAVTVDGDWAVVHAGLLPEVPLRGRPRPTTPVGRLLAALLAEISPLRLPEPGQPGFIAENCRSLHDCIRFAHEQAMAAMFVTGSRRGIGGGRQLATTLPLRLHLVDLGHGLLPAAREGTATIESAQVASHPFQALWQGLNHPAIRWQQPLHFDWQAFGEAVMAGGLAPPDSPLYASYAAVDRDYVHFHIRFGYHYTVVEALAGGVAENNYLSLRFVGGGGEQGGRLLRLVFLAAVLQRLGFRTSRRGEVLDALLPRQEETILLAALAEAGRLLGASRLLDMGLADEETALRFAREFLAGRSDFSETASGGEGGGRWPTS
ncbi:MAG: PEP/pyruvate-binding domain-containing protein [Thermodesulfobacteriota bacterium]